MFFKNNTDCTHSRITPEIESGYCPDCGKFIQNKWYLTRCSCCNVKRKTVIKQGKIQPAEKFCHNCGSKSFVAEKVDKINFIDISYAVLVKTVIMREDFEFTQSWAEARETSSCTRRLLQQFR